MMRRRVGMEETALVVLMAAFFSLCPSSAINKPTLRIYIDYFMPLSTVLQMQFPPDISSTGRNYGR